MLKASITLRARDSQFFRRANDEEEGRKKRTSTTKAQLKNNKPKRDIEMQKYK